MSSLVLIDSSIWIFALGPKPNLEIRKHVAQLVDQNLAAITSPIFFELLAGAKSESDILRLTSYLMALHPFPFLTEEWNEAAQWTRELRNKGLKIKTVDALIAFKAHKHKLTLLHADADMDRIAKKTSLSVDSYVDAVRQASR